MTLDVVIVSYGRGPLLERAVAAVTSFASDANVVIVDNGPKAARTQRPRLGIAYTLIENDSNVGYAAAVNQGVTAGTGDLVLLLNPDIESISGTLEQVEAAFAADTTIGAVTPRLMTPDGRSEPTRRRAPEPFDLIAETLDLASRFPAWQRARRFRMLDVADDHADVVDAATGACLFVRRAALEDVGPFDESFFVYWEETDWLVRAKRRGWCTLYLPTIEAVHVGGGSTDVPDEIRLLLLLEGQHIYSRKHFGRVTAIGLRCFLAALDVVRLLAGFIPGRTRVRSAMQRRLRVHVTGRAPRPQPEARAAELR